MTQIIVLVVKSHIRAVRWSSGGQKARRDKTAFVTGTALHVISGSSAFYQLLRKRQSLHFSSVFLIFFTHLFPHIDTFSWGHPRLQSAEGETCTGCSCSAGLSCFINAKQSRSYRSINNTCRSGPRPIHYTFTIPSVYVQQPAVSWHRTADMSWLLLLRLLCVILGALFSRMKST